MAISAWLVWISGPLDRIYVQIVLFFLQPGLNIVWSFLFFRLRNPRQPLIEVFALWAAILLTMISFLSADFIAGLLLIPYIAWVSVVVFLNYEILRLNPR
jgi:benzodiazapine receptor